ncbi:protein peste-like isoform X2 [Periplaneta americana]|uniref:protein peste-like isoform X2 n=1 Tax=Periplaneta americana TaxID=6978 RepID=UPI0037E96A05
MCLFCAVNEGMILSHGSKVYEMWSKPPVPINMDVYLFNYTNPGQLKEKDYKPHLVQMGPYRFREFHEKVDVVFNENHTVTYRQVRRWYHDAENSNGSLKDNVTTLNVLPIAASAVSRHWSGVLVYPLSAALSVASRSLWLTRPVSEMLFDGYSDPLLSIASNIPGISALELPGDRIGFFYGRNGSAEFDGVFNMETGAADISRLGEMRCWNYLNDSKLYEGECGRITGFAGELFPPGQTKNRPLKVFAVDLCRWVLFDFVEEVEVNDILGYRYALSKTFLDNGTRNPDTECNCGGTCLPQGALNVSTCRKGAPAFASYPHFLDADPYYTRNVQGLSPDPEKHRFHLTIEPTTGAVLDVAARLQINIFLQPNERISLLQNVPTMMFPMMWFEERATISPELSASLRMVLRLPLIGIICSVCLLLLGLVLLGFAFLPRVVLLLLKKDPSSNYTRRATNLQIASSKKTVKYLVTQDNKKAACRETEDSTLLDIK